MKASNLIESIIGAIVLLIAGGFLVFAYEGSQMRVEDGYRVTASFENATGIALGSDVRIGGIKIGAVSDMGLNPETYRAIATMQISQTTKIPKDSSAAIVSSGLLGDKFIEIIPGADDKMLEGGGEIQYTQSSVSLEQLIGKFMFSGGGVEDKNKGKSAGDAHE